MKIASQMAFLTDHRNFWSQFILIFTQEDTNPFKQLTNPPKCLLPDVKPDIKSPRVLDAFISCLLQVTKLILTYGRVFYEYPVSFRSLSRELP